MIIDFIKHLEGYSQVFGGKVDLMKMVSELRDKPVGHYDFGECFAFVQEGVTKAAAEAEFEAHRRFIDVQILIGGSEYMEWAERKSLTVSQPYNEKTDIEFFSGKGETLQMEEGKLYIAFPWDGHKPCLHLSEQLHYRKFVLKIPVSYSVIQIS